MTTGRDNNHLRGAEQCCQQEADTWTHRGNAKVGARGVRLALELSDAAEHEQCDGPYPHTIASGNEGVRHLVGQ